MKMVKTLQRMNLKMIHFKWMIIYELKFKRFIDDQFVPCYPSFLLVARRFVPFSLQRSFVVLAVRWRPTWFGRCAGPFVWPPITTANVVCAIRSTLPALGAFSAYELVVSRRPFVFAVGRLLWCAAIVRADLIDQPHLVIRLRSSHLLSFELVWLVVGSGRENISVH